MKFGLVHAAWFLFLHQLPKTLITQIPFFLWYLQNKLPQVLDVSWAFQHFFTALAAATHNFDDFGRLFHIKTMIFLAYLAVWAVRLGGYIYQARIVVNREPEPRYVEMLQKTKHKNLFMLWQFMSQGFINLLTASPVYFLFNQDMAHLRWNNILGLMISLAGLYGQYTADEQLFTFKKRVNWDKTKTCREGFWAKSRHPNLFFDVMNWAGLAIAAVDMDHKITTFWALGGPIILFLLMNFVTIPATKKEMKKTKVNYEKTLQETNKFIPF